MLVRVSVKSMGKIKSYFADEIEANYEASEPERSMVESQIPDSDEASLEASDKDTVAND